jgi:hypothetical protein
VVRGGRGEEKGAYIADERADGVLEAEVLFALVRVLVENGHLLVTLLHTRHDTHDTHDTHAYEIRATCRWCAQGRGCTYAFVVGVVERGGHLAVVLRRVELVLQILLREAQICDTHPTHRSAPHACACAVVRVCGVCGVCGVPEAPLVSWILESCFLMLSFMRFLIRFSSSSF